MLFAKWLLKVSHVRKIEMVWQFFVIFSGIKLNENWIIPFLNYIICTDRWIECLYLVLGSDVNMPKKKNLWLWEQLCFSLNKQYMF
jgi:hypothetical protein